MKKYSISEEERKYILSISDRYTAKQLSEMYNCSRSFILKLWMNNNYHKPKCFKYYINNDFFESIDNEYKAYILGIVSSDGCVYKRNDHQGLLQITLKNDDLETLEKIKKAMNSTNKINNIGNYSVLSINSDKIFYDLHKLGINPRKTYNLDIRDQINNMDFKFFRHYLRGYFDGDGSISITKNRLPSEININISLPLKNGYYFKEYLNSINISSTVSKDNRGKYNIDFCSLRFNGYNKYILLKYMYYNSNIYMKRKYDRYIDYCYLIENNISNRSENCMCVEKYNYIKDNWRL